MHRRAFLRTLVAGLAGAAALDLDALVWTPGARTIFVPPAGGWITGNTRIPPDVVLREAVRQLTRNLKFADVVNRDWPSLRLGNTVVRSAGSFTVDEQVAVDMMLDRDGCVRGQDAIAAIDSLEEQVRYSGMTTTVMSEIPRMVEWGACQASPSVAVRAISHFDIGCGMPVMRLDVLGAKI